MGTTKSDEFLLEDNKIAKYAKSMAHPARVAILKLLLKKKGCICSHIVDELPLSQSTVSQHLKELKKSGLIKGNIEGVTVCYCINEEEWKRAQQYIGKILKPYKLESNNFCC